MKLRDGVYFHNEAHPRLADQLSALNFLGVPCRQWHHTLVTVSIYLFLMAVSQPRPQSCSDRLTIDLIPTTHVPGCLLIDP
jgi:hypothetical protein